METIKTVMINLKRIVENIYSATITNNEKELNETKEIFEGFILKANDKQVRDSMIYIMKMDIMKDPSTPREIYDYFEKFKKVS